MKKPRSWRRLVTIVLMCIFPYLGTGYQIANYSWRLTHTPEGLASLQDENKIDSAAARVLWPTTMTWNEKDFFAKIKNPGYKTDNKMPVILQVDKRVYTLLITVGWGVKIVINALLAVIILILWILSTVIFVIFFFGKFLWILIPAIITAPFSGT